MLWPANLRIPVQTDCCSVDVEVEEMPGDAAPASLSRACPCLNSH